MARSPFMNLVWMNSLKKMLVRADLYLQQAMQMQLQKPILFLLLWGRHLDEGMVMLT